MDKVAILSGAIGLFVIIGGALLTLGTENPVPLVLGFSFGFVLIVWKHFTNFLANQQRTTHVRNIVEEWDGKEKLEEIKLIVEQQLGGEKIYTGAQTYICILKYYLIALGVNGIEKYTPRKYQVFPPYGIFMMEIEPDPIWDRNQPLYPLLSLKGPNALEHIGTIEAHTWGAAIDEVYGMGNMGLLNAKYMELKPTLAQAAMQGSQVF